MQSPKPFDPERYAAGLREANRREYARIAGKAARAREEAGRLAAAIAEVDPKVNRVFLFGSLIGGGPRHLDFDIDLAIDGGDVYAAEAVAEGSPFAVDVVALRRLPQHVREQIEREGQVLFRRQTPVGDGE